MKSEITSALFLLHVLLVILMVEGRIEILSWPIKQVTGDCETGSDSKINLKNWESGLWKKKQQFNTDKCKLPCKQKCFSKYRMGDYWVKGPMIFLHHAQMWPFNDTEPVEKSHPEKWLFKGWAGGVGISHYVAIGLKSVIPKPVRCWHFSWIADGPGFITGTAIQQEMLKLLDWHR